MAKKKKISRKQLLKEPDEFLTLSSRAVEWARDHQKEMIIATAVFALAGLLLVVGSWHFSRTRGRAMATYERAAATLERLDKEEAANPEAAKAATDQLERVIDQYPRTKAAAMAAMRLGAVAYKNGDYQKAEDWYRLAVKKFSGDPLAKTLAQNGLAHALEGAGKLEQALARFEALKEGPLSGVTQDAAFRAAMIHKKLGDAQKAAEALRNFVDTYPQSPFARLAEEELAQLRG
ncbi:MAG: tetratricopeptide repeat protein [Deltaproteobacteria bacterium]|nr:tetratricopeptide repeat protein [Deltaproteobacteria bacterium]